MVHWLTLKSPACSVAYVMPNLVPPVTTVQMALEYKERLLKVDPTITYLMTLYLHPSITPEVVREAKKAGIAGIKSYPAGLTTNSESGVTDYEQFYPVFEAMEQEGLILVSSLDVRSGESDFGDQGNSTMGDSEWFPLPFRTCSVSLQSMMRPFHLNKESYTLHWETMTQFGFRLQRSEIARIFDFDPSYCQQHDFRNCKDTGVSKTVLS